MKKRLLTLIALLCTCKLLAANPLYQKEAFLIGGGCDQTIGGENFITEFNEWNSFLEENGWHVQGFIDSSKQTQLRNVVEADWVNFKDTLQNLSREHPPKQLFIGIITHGIYKGGKHSICINDTYEPVSELIPILKELKEKGVQIAVIDMSCHSAYTAFELKNTGACIVSMAGTEAGSGAITTAVAKDLPTLHFLGDAPSAEDIWFSVLEQSNKRLRQIPQITGLQYTHPEHLENSITAEDQSFFYENEDVFQHLFSDDSIQGMKNFLQDSSSFFAFHHAILGLKYLERWSDRKRRPCANFYF